MRNTAVELGAPGRFEPRRWFWVCWAVLCALLLIGSAMLLAEHYKVTDKRVYSGTFASTGRTTGLVVPAGVPVLRILVSEGDQVVSGQRLARFDSDALDERIEQVSLEILLGNTLQECLLNKSVLSDDAIVAMELDATARLAVQATLRECRLTHRQFGLELDGIQTRIKALRNRADLAVQTLVTDRELRQTMSPREIALRAAVERQKFTGSIKPLELQLAKLATDHEARLLKQVAALREEAMRLGQVLMLLEGLVETPWLIAPESGHVQRLRPVAEHTVFNRETQIITLSGAEQETLEANALISRDQAKRFEKGDPALVRLSGMPVNSGPLHAQVTDIFETPGQVGAEMATTVVVELGLEDIEDPQLRRLVTRQMEVGDSGGSITFELGQISLLEAVLRSMDGLLSAGVQS